VPELKVPGTISYEEQSVLDQLESVKGKTLFYSRVLRVCSQSLEKFQEAGIS
jgi:hypothetical protein